jgi:hypothetical protein
MWEPSFATFGWCQWQTRDASTVIVRRQRIRPLMGSHMQSSSAPPWPLLPSGSVASLQLFRVCALLPCVPKSFLQMSMPTPACQDIVTAQGRGLVLLAGDVNARPKERPDWVAGGSDEHNVALQHALAVGEEGASPTSIPRQSQDRGTNIGYANELLHLCQTTGMRIANGRVAGDETGACTCYPVGGGSSQVDFFLGCPRVFPLLSRRSCGTRWGACRKALPLLWCWPRQGFTPLPLTGASWRPVSGTGWWAFC